MALLNHFGEAAAILAFRKRLQHGGIHEYEPSRIESTYEVLTFWQIHSGFSTDGAVHL